MHHVEDHLAVIEAWIVHPEVLLLSGEHRRLAEDDHSSFSESQGDGLGASRCRNDPCLLGLAVVQNVIGHVRESKQGNTSLPALSAIDH